MYCIKCGADNLETAKFCRKCGESFEAEEETRVAVRGESLAAVQSHLRSPSDDRRTRWPDRRFHPRQKFDHVAPRMESNF